MASGVGGGNPVFHQYVAVETPGARLYWYRNGERRGQAATRDGPAGKTRAELAFEEAGPGDSGGVDASGLYPWGMDGKPPRALPSELRL